MFTLPCCGGPTRPAGSPLNIYATEYVFQNKGKKRKDFLLLFCIYNEYKSQQSVRGVGELVFLSGLQIFLLRRAAQSEPLLLLLR